MRINHYEFKKKSIGKYGLYELSSVLKLMQIFEIGKNIDESLLEIRSTFHVIG